MTRVFIDARKKLESMNFGDRADIHWTRPEIITVKCDRIYSWTDRLTGERVVPVDINKRRWLFEASYRGTIEKVGRAREWIVNYKDFDFLEVPVEKLDPVIDCEDHGRTACNECADWLMRRFVSDARDLMRAIAGGYKRPRPNTVDGIRIHRVALRGRGRGKVL